MSTPGAKGVVEPNCEKERGGIMTHWSILSRRSRVGEKGGLTLVLKGTLPEKRGKKKAKLGIFCWDC